MKRRLCNLALVASTLLSVAIGVLWVRSYWMGDHLVVEQLPSLGRASRRVDLQIRQGRFVIGARVHWEILTQPEWSLAQPAMAGWRDPAWSCRRESFPAGFPPVSRSADTSMLPYMGTLPSKMTSSTSIGFMHAHLAWPFALAALAPMIWTIRRVRARRRFPIGHCPRCGYDLRATPERCPECGRAV